MTAPHVTREHALSLVAGAKSRDEDPRALVVLSFDPAAPELAAVARNLFSTSLVFNRTGAERVLGPWVIGLPKAHAFALLEAQRIVPIDGRDRANIDAGFAALAESEVMSMLIEGSLGSPRVRLHPVDLNPPPPVIRRVHPRWRLTAGPASSVYGIGAGAEFAHDPKMVATLRHAGFTMVCFLPYEVRRGSHFAIEWLAESQVAERTSVGNVDDLDPVGHYLVQLELAMHTYRHEGRYVVLSREERPQLMIPGDQLRTIAEQCAGPMIILDAPGGPRRIGLPREVIVPAFKQIGPDEWIETSAEEREAAAAPPPPPAASASDTQDAPKAAPVSIAPQKSAQRRAGGVRA